MPTLYYWTPFTSLRKGHIISKGHWGDGIKNSPLTHINATREIIYEEVRRKHFPDRPSRLESIFLCTNKESAKQFGGIRKNETLYEVEIIDKTAKQFIANWNMMASKDRSTSYSDVITYAKDYWSGVDVPVKFQELVIESDVRVLKKTSI